MPLSKRTLQTDSSRKAAQVQMAYAVFTSEREPVIHTDLPITLTDTEERIFTAVEECLKFHKLSTVVRVAGGWVRDKILGEDSDDIDLSLDNMMGLGENA